MYSPMTIVTVPRMTMCYIIEADIAGLVYWPVSSCLWVVLECNLILQWWYYVDSLQAYKHIHVNHINTYQLCCDMVYSKVYHIEEILELWRIQMQDRCSYICADGEPLRTKFMVQVSSQHLISRLII